MRNKVINQKAIISGRIAELYDYSRPLVQGYTGKRVGRANSAFTSEEVKEENRKKTAFRARATVRRMINANPQLNKFLTLTFAENLQDIETARYELKKFILRLIYRFPSFSYIEVIEFQKRGAVHFHILCNLEYVDVNELAKIWRNGFIKLNRIDNIDNLGAYVTKYMKKDNKNPRSPTI